LNKRLHRLSIELVPASASYKNCRQILTKAQWDILSKQVRSAVYDTCEICGNDEGFHDCHEIWFYDDHNSIQKLIGLQSLCKNCHGVKHFGFSQIQGKGAQTLRHFMKVNNLSYKDAEESINKSFEVWGQRSKKRWTLDVSILSDYGIKIKDSK
jgi:hypothetical protein